MNRVEGIVFLVNTPLEEDSLCNYAMFEAQLPESVGGNWINNGPHEYAIKGGVLGGKVW